jgi:hypothetical protein
MLAFGQHHAENRDLVERTNGFPDHGVGVVADLAVGNDVIGPDELEVVDLGRPEQKSLI